VRVHPAEPTALPDRYRPWLGLLWAALLLSACVGIFGRGYWTPDEPREADIAWRMSWQPGKAVPLLAGEAFCEKPPLAYWLAATAIAAFGPAPAAARLPNLLYALVTALAVGFLGRRCAGTVGGIVAAAAISTFLLSYQVAIWLATDAPLLAAVSVAISGLYVGFYAADTRERLRGYTIMHAALAVGFLCKSAVAWMVPVLTVVTLVIWERRWRELWRWELYLGLALQAAAILIWIWFVYVGPDGTAHLKVFFWNNLAGRFAHVDAPEELQYASAHRNSPGKYLRELPAYLWPWTLLIAAALRAAWRQRHASTDRLRPVRFALATFVPTLGVLSIAATARNIYLAPALPGAALLLGWWASDFVSSRDPWDARALRATSALLLLAAIVVGAAVIIVGWDSWSGSADWVFAAVSAFGLAMSAAFVVAAWRAAGRGSMLRALLGLVIAYCALLAGPASQIYRRVDGWQDLSTIGRAIARDAAGRPLLLFAPDETTRAFIDMYAETSVGYIAGPITSTAVGTLTAALGREPPSLVVTQLPGRAESAALYEIAGRLGLQRLVPARRSGRDPLPAWVSSAHLHILYLYALPNGRRYALLGVGDASSGR
jgi:4-amino-4-deoxy-L-arabinose transferase-like glycosyltransferase